MRKWFWTVVLLGGQFCAVCAVGTWDRTAGWVVMAPACVLGGFLFARIWRPTARNRLDAAAARVPARNRSRVLWYGEDLPPPGRHLLGVVIDWGGRVGAVVGVDGMFVTVEWADD